MNDTRCKIYKFIDDLLNQEDLMALYEINENEFKTEYFINYMNRYRKVKNIIYKNPMNCDENGNISKDDVGYNSDYLPSTELFIEFYKNKYYRLFNINQIKSNNDKITIIPVNLTHSENIKKHGHLILVFYIKNEDKFYILDPSGISSTFYYFIDAITIMFENYEIIVEMNQLQQREGQIENYNGEIGGYCEPWCYLFIKCYMIDYTNLNEIIECILCACNGDPIILRKLIRIFSYECIYGY